MISSVLHDDTSDDIICSYTMIHRMISTVLHDDTADDILCATR